MIWLLALTAFASPLRVVRAGDTVESIAAELGHVSVEQLRTLNGLDEGEQPTVGAVIGVPEHETHIDRPATILSITGTGTARTPAGVVPLETGLDVPIGSTVCTDAMSYASVRLAVDLEDRSHDDIVLLSGTCITVDAVVVDARGRSSTLTVDAGTIAVRSIDTRAGTVNVLTDDGVTTGESGGFRVTREVDATRTEALYHPVAVLSGGAELVLDAGFGSRARKGIAPDPRHELPPAGRPVLPDSDDLLRRPDFSWTSVERALGYRVELAADDAFSRILYAEDVPAEIWLPDFLFLPYQVPALFWRVSSFDRTGYLGIPSEPRSLRFPAGVGP